MLPIINQFAPPPVTPSRSPWPMVFGVGCVIVVLFTAWLIWRVESAVSTLTSGENRPLADAVLMVALADENVIRSSAARVAPADLVADPAAYDRKWVAVTGSVVILQNPHGAPISQSQAQPDEQVVYWLEGPVAVIDTSDALPVAAAGASVTAWGRPLVVAVNKLGLNADGKAQLTDLAGGEIDQVPLIIAKWVEAP
ncbi:hypothetical protein JW859_03965 [bacterium]|nr:hypothetical protein [bacterium]